MPELPQSSGAPGALSPPSPAPRTVSVGSPSSSASSSTSTPSWRRQASVERGSAASENPTIRLSPSATAAKIAARWATDLSAGSAGAPASAAAG